MKTSESTKEIFAALTAAQGKLDNATKSSKNPHLRNSYADLTSVITCVRPVFAEHDLALVQSPEYDGERLVMATRIIHKSGEWIEGIVPVIFGESKGINIMQALGSAISYSRRYGAMAMTSLGTEDNDGHSAAPVRRAENQNTRAPEPQSERVIENPIDDHHIDVLVSDLSACSSGEVFEALKTQAASFKANMNNEQIKRVGSAVNSAMTRLGVK